MAGPMMRIVISLVAFATPKVIERSAARHGGPNTPAEHDPLDVDGYKAILGTVLSSRP